MFRKPILYRIKFKPHVWTEMDDGVWTAVDERTHTRHNL